MTKNIEIIIVQNAYIKYMFVWLKQENIHKSYLKVCKLSTSIWEIIPIHDNVNVKYKTQQV